MVKRDEIEVDLPALHLLHLFTDRNPVPLDALNIPVVQ
jgi:hypothetical protein